MTAERWREEKREGESPPSESALTDLARSESAPSLASLWARAIENAEIAARLQKEESDAGQRPEPEPDEDRNRREAVSILLRAIESSDYAARLQPAESDAGQRPEPAPDEKPSGHETAATLLRAIESTEFAASPQKEAPGIAQPDLPTPSGPPKSDATIPTSTLLDHPLVLTPAPRSGSAAREKAPDRAPPSPSRSVAEHSPGAPFGARLKGEVRRLARKIGESTRVLLDSAEERLSTWLLNWFPPPPPQDRRGSERLFKPPLVAFYWTGGAPRPQVIAEISSSGLYLVTRDTWLPDTRVSMTLQRTDQKRGTPGTWITVDVKVIRLGNDGFGGAFIPPMPPTMTGPAHTAARRAEIGRDKETLERFVKRLSASTQL